VSSQEELSHADFSDFGAREANKQIQLKFSASPREKGVELTRPKQSMSPWRFFVR